MSRIDEEEAARTLALLTEMGEVQAELDSMRASAQAGGSADA
jgi:hydrogenase expression/formation protein HypC